MTGERRREQPAAAGGQALREQPEVWGGMECTTNRVNETFIDQTRLTGHHERDGDLDLFAALGISRLRYPVLWERTAPERLVDADWSWPDRRLARLRELGIQPIVGLVHHGSGPRGTSLIDPEFPAKLASYARAVAERYPWVRDWTPINEAVTTARFSALYGIWYPHARSAELFVRALVNQCLGVALAMREIRAVIPGARLVQTEDCGRVHGTNPLRYQADFENRRQGAAFDLLSGRVSRRHSLWRYLTSQGAPPADLEALASEPCRPDVIGVNYYVTSDRFLDHRLGAYPVHTHGGNGRHRYADVEAARVRGVGIDGHLQVLRRLWRRHQIPLAITEVHLGGPREDQLRWLGEAWEAATLARGEGIPVEAVTAWSLLGAFGWDRLVSAPGGRYESGVFDLRSTAPRPTALAAMITALARGAPADARQEAVARTLGWWRRPDGVIYQPDPARGDRPTPRASPGMRRGVTLRSGARGGAVPAEHTIVAGRAFPADPSGSPSTQQPVLITGGGGTLGRALARILAERGLSARVVTRGEANIADVDVVRACIDDCMPWAVVNAAGYARVDEAEGEAERCWSDNVAGPVALAGVCRRVGIPLVTFSSDQVFDGRIDRPYNEQDEPGPLGVYGRSKREAELRILEVLPETLIIRSAAFFGPWDQRNFVHLALQALGDGREFEAASDLVISPTYVPDLVHAALDLLIDGATGIWHVANDGAMSWADLARRAATAAGYSASLVKAQPFARFGLRARRPAFSALATSRGRLLRSVDAALEAYVRERVIWRDGFAFGTTGMAGTAVVPMPTGERRAWA